MDKVNLGIIGLGNWGSKLANSLQKIPEANLVSCFARTQKKREDFANKHNCAAKDSLDKLLDDKDLHGVIISTPHSTHKDLILEVAKAKKHIMVEKPLTLNSDHAKVCIDCAKKNDVYIQVAHYRRLLPATRLLKKYIADDYEDYIYKAISISNDVNNLNMFFSSFVVISSTFLTKFKLIFVSLL